MRLSEYLRWLGRPIAYYPSLARLVGGVKAAVFLCQLLYWHERSSHPDREIYKSIAKIEEETGLTKEEQRTARRELVARKLLHERYARLDHQLFFRIDLDALDKLAADLLDFPKSGNPISGSEETRFGDEGKPDSPKAGNPISGSEGSRVGDAGDPVFATTVNPSSYMKEITTETTTEITTTTTTTPVVVGKGIEWPSLPASHRQLAERILTECPAELRQPVIDEWAVAIRDGKIQRSSPIPYLRSLVKRAVAGSFTPDAGIAIAARRLDGDADGAYKRRKAAAIQAMDERIKRLHAAQVADKRTP